MPLDQESFNPSDDSGFSAGDDNIKWMSERHVACVFLLDTSGSMSGQPIKELNKGIQEFKTQTLNNPTFDEHTKSCIDVAVVTFDNEAKIIQDFVPIEKMEIPPLSTGGMTAMGAALNLGLDMITERKRIYNELGTPYYRPWIFCITDGGPNDDYLGAVQRLKEMEANKGVLGYCVGVSGFSKNVMAQIFDITRIFELTDLDFTALFQFVSNSLGAIRNSDPAAGNTIDAPAPNNLKLAF